MSRELVAAVDGVVADCTRVDIGAGTLWASPPARLEKRGDCGVAWMYPSGPTQPDADPRGPDLRLSLEGLELTSGPLPQYPLYYYRSPDDSILVVSSDITALLELCPSGGLDERRLVTLLAWQLDADPGATPFIALRRVCACEVIRAGPNGIVSVTRVPRAGTSYLRLSPRDLATELREGLRRAIDRAIGDARRVAVHVGGGLDSSGVLALTLARSRGARPLELEALAEVWAAPGDDTPYVTALERDLGIDAIRLRPEQAAPWFEPSLCTDLQPQIFSAACGDMLLWDTGRLRGADVSLTGHGGDIVCGGELSFDDLVRRGHLLRAMSRALRLDLPRDLDVSPLHRLSRWVLRPLFVPLLRPLVPRSIIAAKRRHAARKTWMTRKFVDLLVPLLLRTRRRPRTPDERMAQVCSHPVFAEMCVAWGQMSRLTRSAPADVFRDVDFVRFVAQIPPHVLSHGDLHRGLYRLAMKGMVPESTRMRRDKALGQPFVATAALAAGATNLLEDLASLDRLAALDLIDPDGFRVPFSAWLRSVRRGERYDNDEADSSWNGVWPLLATEAFLRHLETNVLHRWPQQPVRGIFG